MGRSARGAPPRGRCPGTGEVDSRERRLVVWISALAARVSLGTRRAVPKVTSRSQEERWMKRYAWAMLGLGLWVAGMEGGTRWALGQTPPPTIGPQQNRSFNPATTIPFKVSGELFLKGHRPVVSLKINSPRSEEHTSELQSRSDLVCRLLLE